MASLRLRALAADVEAGEARALEDFWREVGPAAELERRVDAVYDRTLHILDEAASRGVTPLAVADRVVADRLCVETAAAGGGP